MLIYLENEICNLPKNTKIVYSECLLLLGVLLLFCFSVCLFLYEPPDNHLYFTVGLLNRMDLFVRYNFIRTI